jgi:hypothetical protein
MPREATLVVLEPASRRVLVSPDGSFPSVSVEVPWWAEASTLVAAARQRVGVPVVLVRRLSVEAGTDGGDSSVTYLFEAPSGSVPSAGLDWVEREVPGDADHPLRLPWARPGFLAGAVEWIDGVLAEHRRERTGDVRQEKWWNLSAVMEAPTSGGPVWCKYLPQFFHREPAVIAAVAARNPGDVPRMLAGDAMTGRMLIDDVEGEDQWEAGSGELTEMVRRLLAVQLSWAGEVDGLLALGVKDRRFATLVSDAAALVAREDVARLLGADEFDRLLALAQQLPSIAGEVERVCGFPDTLLHGDFHPGNVRGRPGSLVILDWTDAAVGHPLLDAARCVASARDRDGCRSAVLDEWRKAVPGCDVERALGLIEPLEQMSQALTYQEFLDKIEPAEHIDHAADVPAALRRALAATAAAPFHQQGPTIASP